MIAKFTSLVSQISSRLRFVKAALLLLLILIGRLTLRRFILMMLHMRFFTTMPSKVNKTQVEHLL